MTKFYTSKSNALRAFRSQYTDAAAPLTSGQIVELGYVDEDAPGQWVINNPATWLAVINEQEAPDFAMSAEKLAKQAVRPSVQDAQVQAKVAAEAATLPSAGALEVHNTDLPKEGADFDGRPHCKHSTIKGKQVTEFNELSPGSQRDTTQLYTCNNCTGEWGPVVDNPKAARAPSGTSNGLKIEQNRETRNGVTRPSIGGKCRGVWDMLDGIGTDATAKQAREAATGKFDKTTTMVQFYRWRKFQGIEGRQ